MFAISILNPNYDVINDVISGFAKVVVERRGFHHWIAQRISRGEVVSVFLYLLYFPCYDVINDVIMSDADRSPGCEPHSVAASLVVCLRGWKLTIFDISLLCFCCFTWKLCSIVLQTLAYDQFILSLHVHRLLSQAVNDEVCKAIKNLVDAQAKSRKLVWIVTTVIICTLARYRLSVVFLD